MSKRVAIAMSGGVDSSVAAYLLHKAGYEVIGVTMLVAGQGSETKENKDSASPLLAVARDARRVADHLGIPLYVFDLQDLFSKEVVAYFTSSYLKGLTPNPCVVCNKRIKFQALAVQALALGADYLATGHYAQKGYESSTGRFTLQRGKDRGKDQSYVLFGLTQEQLAGSLFPLGGYLKEEIRRLAEEEGIPTAGKPESQEICFIPDNDYGRFLRETRPESVQPGEIVTLSGEVLGRHQGVAFYTIGQRKGLGIAAPEPYYVVELCPAKRRVVVGGATEVYTDGMIVDEVNWVSIPPLSTKRTVMAQIRSAAPPVRALVTPINEYRVSLEFEAPQRAVTPGQAAVFYQEELLLGGGFITKS